MEPYRRDAKDDLGREPGESQWDDTAHGRGNGSDDAQARVTDDRTDDDRLVAGGTGDRLVAGRVDETWGAGQTDRNGDRHGSGPVGTDPATDTANDPDKPADLIVYPDEADTPAPGDVSAPAAPVTDVDDHDSASRTTGDGLSPVVTTNDHSSPAGTTDDGRFRDEGLNDEFRTGVTNDHPAPATDDDFSRTGVTNDHPSPVTDEDSLPAGVTNDHPATDAETSVTGAGEDSDVDFQQRWREVQAGFVDDPQDAVRQADQLVEEAVAALAKRRQALADRWKNGDEKDTEQLRLALRDYRSLLQELVGLSSTTNTGRATSPVRH
ncbi:hypothetical protein [Sphaerisporangium sp. TRM90804]|uniref:hypothetical protein n=1 Tax=Sphaerisporangium sp. TRM90804 TaxID=3031113 RepID=UPI002447CF7E|nr:hypothetical protein [Sphaerisporangium sp. TRM90804]MDH2428463.1 hypothetical protein [Sphaerisporangium sp. TRM90804]